MSDIPSQNNIQDLKILVAIPGNTEILPQDQCHYTIVRPDEGYDKTHPEFYNWVISTHNADAMIFLGPNSNFTRSDSLYTMVSSLYEDVIYGACYCDNLLYNKNHGIVTSKYFSTFGDQDEVINSGVCITKLLLDHVRFNEKIKSICLWDILMSLSHKTMILHIPEILISAPMIMEDVTADLEVINT